MIQVAKHAVSFRDLLVLRTDTITQLKSFETLVNTMNTYGCNVPPAITTKVVMLKNRKLELDSIKRDRFEQSERRQAKIGYGVTF